MRVSWCAPGASETCLLHGPVALITLQVGTMRGLAVGGYNRMDEQGGVAIGL